MPTESKTTTAQTKADAMLEKTKHTNQKKYARAPQDLNPIRL
jgi:hypothetical protein